MCKEDIRIKRKTKWNGGEINPYGGGATKLLSANPERVTFSAGMLRLAAMNDTDTVMIFVLDGGVRQGLFTFSPTSGYGTVRVEDIGQLITGEIWAVATLANGIELWYNEVVLTQPLEQT